MSWIKLALTLLELLSWAIQKAHDNGQQLSGIKEALDALTKSVDARVAGAAAASTPEQRLRPEDDPDNRANKH